MRKTKLKKVIEEAEEVNSSILSFAKSHKIPNEYFEYIPVEAHPVVVSATRKLKILAPHFVKLLKDIIVGINGLSQSSATLSKEYSNSDLSRTHDYKLTGIAIWSKNNDTVISYPNLWVSNRPVYSSAYNYTNDGLTREIALFPKVTERLASKIKLDISNGRTESWTPVSRGIKRLGANREQSLSGYLAKHLMFCGKSMQCIQGGSQVIDAISARVHELYAPTEFCFADTVKDIRFMYTVDNRETPTSCMDSKHSFGLRYTDGSEARPVDFYAHCPITRGAYLKRGNTVLARTICWLDTLTDRWFFGRVYGNRSAYQTSLINKLKAEVNPATNYGYTQLSDDRHWFPGRSNYDYAPYPNRAVDTFTMPYALTGDGYEVALMPYLDQLPFNSIKVDTAKSEWTYHINHSDSHEKGDHPVDVRATCGYYYPDGGSSDDYVYCVECDAEHWHEDAMHVRGDYFCDSQCAIDYGLRLYVQSDNSRWESLDGVPANAIPAFGQSAWFSNYQAAINNLNASVYLPSLFAETEVDCFVYCRRIDYPFLPSVLLTKPGGYQGIYQLALHRSRDVYLAETKNVDMTVAKSVISNMNQSYLENIQCMHALSSSIIDTVPCKRNIEDNLHIKDSYEFISNMRSRSLFDFDIEKQDEALADAFSKELGGLPKLLRGELPKLKQFVTTN